MSFNDDPDAVCLEACEVPIVVDYLSKLNRYDTVVHGAENYWKICQCPYHSSFSWKSRFLTLELEWGMCDQPMIATSVHTYHVV